MPPNPWNIPRAAEENARTCIRAAEMRARGASWAEIQAELGLETQKAARLCAEKGYGLAPGEDLRIARRRAAGRTGPARRELWKDIEGPGPVITVSGKIVRDPETKEPLKDRRIRIDAINALRGVSDAYRKLYGTDAPRQSVSIVASARLEDLQAAIEQMRAEVAEAERRGRSRKRARR